MTKSDYLTNCEYGSKRNADYDMAKTITDKWEFAKEDFDGHGNLCSDVMFDPRTKKAKFKTKKEQNCSVDEMFKQVGFWRAIPAALLAYRLACTFEGAIKAYGQEGYKVTWDFPLKHKATGELIKFGEWKGGALFWTNGDEVKGAHKKDMLELLTYLVSDTCAHPYDGVVAGSVA